MIANRLLLVFIAVVDRGETAAGLIRGGRQQGASIVLEDFPHVFEDVEPTAMPRLPSMRNAMADIYGQPVCAGNEAFVSAAAAAPANFCASPNMQPEFIIQMAKKEWRPQTPPGHFPFDQFALERIMIGKWASLPHARWSEDGSNTGQKPNVVVVPSLRMQLLQLDGYYWEAIEPQMYSNFTDKGWPWIQARFINTGVEELAHRRYWNLIRAKWYKPEQGLTPVVVMHYSFTWDTQNSLATLRALAEQPADFNARVVIGALESNLPREQGSASFALPSFLQDWQRSAEPKTTPLLVSLPYPTAVLETASFAASQHNRRIKILMDFNDKPFAWIRGILQEQMKEAGGHSVICAKKHDKYPDHCGLDEKQRGVYEMAAQSVFCLEPAGDSPTRSHFYVAVQSGCIPVIFDGGNSLYGNSTVTSWPWRRSTEPRRDAATELFFEYDDFAVVFNSQELLNGRNAIRELLDMIDRHPQKLQAMRWNLDRAAPRLSFRRETCSAEHGNCEDAFWAFSSLVFRQLERKDTDEAATVAADGSITPEKIL